MKRAMVLVCLGSLLGTLAASVASAQVNYVWNDPNQQAQPGLWTDANKWNPVGVPAVVDSAIIDGPAPDASITAYNDCLVDAGGAVTALYVGNNYDMGPAEWLMSGGALAVGDDIIVGNAAAGVGHARVTGGDLTIADQLFVGNNGVGDFTFDGDTLGINLFIKLGQNAGSQGTLNINGGAVTAATGDPDNEVVLVGNNGEGTLNMSGGTFAANIVKLANSAGTGSLNVSGGEFTASNWIGIGINSAGTCSVGGTGILTTQAAFVLGSRNGSGVVDVNGGTLNAANLVVGQSNVVPGGSGVFTQTAGTVNVDGAVTVALNVGASGELYLYGGVMNAGDLAINDGGQAEIRAGVLNLAGDDVDVVLGYVGDGKLVAYEGRQTVDVVYDAGNDVTVVSAQPVSFDQAWQPSPGQGALVDGGKRDSLVLRWRKGDHAVSHNVYLGSDEAAVVAADTGTAGIFRGNFADNEPDNQYAVGESLNLEQTYYWRIDEVNGDSSVTTGTLWQFTMADYVVLDGFESYADTAALQASWTGADALATEPARETQALQFNYSTASGAYQDSVTGAIDPNTDLVAAGVEALTLYFRGVDDNDPESLSVTLTDASNQSATVVYPGSASDLVMYDWQVIGGAPVWREWNIDLDDFTGVNVAALDEIAVTVGDGVAPGGTGTLYLDDIRVYRPRCVVSDADGDLAGGDCFVDFNDYLALQLDWNTAAAQVNAVAPTAAPVLLYHFDEVTGTVAADASGNGFDGTIDDGFGGHWDVAGVLNGCLEFDATFGVTVPAAAAAGLDQQVTVSLWINGDVNVQPAADVLFVGEGAASYDLVKVHGPWFAGTAWPDMAWISGADDVRWDVEVLADFAGVWTHYAFVKDVAADYMAIFRNGELVAESDAAESMAGIIEFRIGRDVGNRWYYAGKIDEFAMYDAALSQAEILYLAQGPGASLTQPLLSPADPTGDGVVDWADLSVVAGDWLTELLWPAP